jgi:hypothetical protein
MPTDEAGGNLYGFKDYGNAIWCTFITVMTSNIIDNINKYSWVWRLLSEQHLRQMLDCICNVLGKLYLVTNYCISSKFDRARQR